jgi:hypothetical protein
MVENLLIFSRFDYTTEWGKPVQPQLPEFFCFVSGLRRGDDGSAVYSKRWQRIARTQDGRLQLSESSRDAVESYCRAIQLAILRRAETDSIFPPAQSVKFWNLVDDSYSHRVKSRPWDEDPSGRAKQVPTATLSFDLRRSTFLMEHAIDKKAYADWLEILVIILKEILHLRGGVFDKFTGDGVLAHFPAYEFDVYSSEDALETAYDTNVLNCISCGWDMIRAAEICSDVLVPNISLSNENCGSAVGAAFDNAQWSVGRAGNPVVVGRGVVHACRLSGGEPGTMQLTNAIVARLKRMLGNAAQFEETDFVSKEYSAGSGVKMYKMTSAPRGLVTDDRTLSSIVQRAFSDSRRYSMS